MPVYQLGNINDDFNSADQPDWASNSDILGGNGNDTIVTTLLDFTPTVNLFVDGGNGDDTLTSNGGGSGMQPGNALTGGLGRDTFILDSGTGNLVVTNDAAGDGIVSDGDTFKGPMDVITDL